MAKQTAKDKKETIVLKNKDILESLNAFSALDKCKFEPTMMLAIAKTGIALKNAAAATLEVRDKIAKEYFPEGQIETSSKKFPEYKSKVEEALEAESEIAGVTKLSSADLKLEENEIPISVLMALDWLIES